MAAFKGKITEEIIQKEEETNTKYCSKCSTYKSRTEFHKAPPSRPKGWDRYGLRPWCKKCILAKNGEYENDPKRSFANKLLRAARKRARDKGIPFQLRQSWIQERIDKGICSVSGKTFEYNGYKEGTNPNQPSLDRIDSAKGYTEDNLQLVCTWYNWAKNVMTDEQTLQNFRDLLEYKSNNKDINDTK